MKSHDCPLVTLLSCLCPQPQRRAPTSYEISGWLSWKTAWFERIVLMSVGSASKILGFFPLLVSAAVTLFPRLVNAQTNLEIGIGIQNTTTNTVTGGVVLKELGLFEKHLPNTGKYKDFKYSLSWQNATSRPPLTNGIMPSHSELR